MIISKYYFCFFLSILHIVLKNKQKIIYIFKIVIGSKVECKLQLLVIKTLAFYWTKTAIKWTLNGFRKYTRRIKFSNKTIFLCRLSWFFCTWLNRSQDPVYCVVLDTILQRTNTVSSVQACSCLSIVLTIIWKCYYILFLPLPRLKDGLKSASFGFEEGRRAEGQDVMWGKIKYFWNTK